MVLIKSVVFKSTHSITLFGTPKFVLTTTLICVISSFRRKIDANCASLGYHIESIGNLVPIVWGQNIGPDVNDSLPRNVGNKLSYWLRNNKEECNYQPHCLTYFGTDIRGSFKMIPKSFYF